MDMAQVEWIKLKTDMFDNRKIKHLRKMPEGNTIVLIWVMLLAMAGRCNAGGKIFLTETIPYTPKMLAEELEFEEETIERTLETLDQLQMVVKQDGYYTVVGWYKHQNVEGMERVRDQTRKRVERHRAHQEEVAALKAGETYVDYNAIRDAYHTHCPSLSPIKALTKTRKTKIKEVLSQFTKEDLIEAFKKVESSDFLSGRKGDWNANFDWIIDEVNLVKILEGNYDNRNSKRYAPQGGSEEYLDF